MSAGNAWGGVVGTLLGAIVGGTITHGVAWLLRRKKHKAYWSALSAEVDLCRGLAEAYVRHSVKAPLYRLPTIAYDKGFEALLADGVVSEEDVRSILRFYAHVIQINRGLEYAHSATEPEAPEGALDRQAGRLLLSIT